MLGRLVLYVRDVDAVATFYGAHFGFERIDDPADRIVALTPKEGGAELLLHPAAKSQMQGQALVKLVFDVVDVAGRKNKLIAAGIKVGPVHQADGYTYANLKDPAGNSVQISSRGLRVG